MSPFRRSADSAWSSKLTGRTIVGVRGNYQNAFGESCRSESCYGLGLFSDTPDSLKAGSDGSYTID
jgi:hypothetical protein